MWLLADRAAYMLYQVCANIAGDSKSATGSPAAMHNCYWHQIRLLGWNLGGQDRRQRWSWLAAAGNGVMQSCRLKSMRHRVLTPTPLKRSWNGIVVLRAGISCALMRRGEAGVLNTGCWGHTCQSRSQPNVVPTAPMGAPTGPCSGYTIKYYCYKVDASNPTKGQCHKLSDLLRDSDNEV